MNCAFVGNKTQLHFYAGMFITKQNFYKLYTTHNFRMFVRMEFKFNAIPLGRGVVNDDGMVEASRNVYRDTLTLCIRALVPVKLGATASRASISHTVVTRQRRTFIGGF